MIDRPISCLTLELIGMIYEHLRYFRVLGVVWFGFTEE